MRSRNSESPHYSCHLIRLRIVLFEFLEFSLEMENFKGDRVTSKFFLRLQGLLQCFRIFEKSCCFNGLNSFMIPRFQLLIDSSLSTNVYFFFSSHVGSKCLYSILLSVGFTTWPKCKTPSIKLMFWIYP